MRGYNQASDHVIYLEQTCELYSIVASLSVLNVQYIWTETE